ncbi:MAG TPA: hypothetical protein VF879_02905, partial [Nitrospirales bacterium]
MIADIVRLFTSTAVVQIMTLIRNLAVARLLSPDIAGACISWLALPQAGAYCSLGLVDALPFLVPYHRGRHGKEDVESVKNQVWTLHGLVSFGVMILAVVGVWVFPFASGEMRLFGLLACGLFGINQLSKFAVMELAAEHRFDLLSRTEVLYAALLLVTSVVGMAAWHGTGFWGALMLSNAAVVGYVYRRQLRHERIRWVQPDWTVLRGLVPTGIVMAVAATIYLPFVLIARLSVASVLGVQAAGHFFLASVLMTFLAVVPRTLARVMLPHLSLSYGGGQSLRETLPVFAKIQIASL